MRLFLIGFMGSGKSTIGRHLANSLNMQYIDLDAYIQQKENQTINDIFTTFGEPHFREIETKHLREIAKQDNVVVSTGGGTPCHAGNMQFLKEYGLTIYLKCSPDMLYNRLLNSKNKRPLLEGKNEIELKDYIFNTLVNREPYYNQSNIIIDNPSRDIKQILDVLSYYNIN